MNKSLGKICATMFLLLASSLYPVVAQPATDKWARVYTGDYSIIDLNVASLSFADPKILRIKFRTILARAEKVDKSGATKFKTRIETIDFRLNQDQYRIAETVLLNEEGAKVATYEATAADDWRVLKAGGVMHRLFEAARELPPFGRWKVTGYRFAPEIPEQAEELKQTLGTGVSLRSDSVQVGASECTAPAFHTELMSAEQFRRKLDLRLPSIGITSTEVETIVIKCDRGGWRPPHSLLVKLPAGGMLILWKGVFLELKRESLPKSSGVTLKRRAP